MPGSGAKLRAHTWPGAGGTVVDPDGRLDCWSFSIPPSQTFPVPFPDTSPRPVGAPGGVQEFTGSIDGSGQMSPPSKDGDGEEEAVHISSSAVQLFLFLFSALFLKFIDSVCVCVCERESGGEREPERQGGWRKKVSEALGLVKQRLPHTRGLPLPRPRTQESTAVALRL